MPNEKGAVLALLASLSIGCTSTYQVRFGDIREDWPSARVGIEHCLSSLGFGDVSSQDLYPEFMEEDPSILQVWKPTLDQSWFDVAPFSVAWIMEHESELLVHFQPGNSQGSHAEFFAKTFSRCIEIHDPGAKVRTTSSKIVPDLR